MWWIIIIIVVVLIIIGFSKDLNKEANNVARSGGMRVKYRTLIDHYLKEDNRARINQETPTFINIGYPTLDGQTALFITHTFKKVVIEWKVNSRVFGKHQLKWQFDENADQMEMIRKIDAELAAYQAHIIKNHSDMY